MWGYSHGFFFFIMPYLQSFLNDFTTLLTDIQDPLDALFTASVLVCISLPIVVISRKIIKRFLKL